MPTNESNTQVRAYFLQQGASIAKLNTILSSNLLVHHLKKWLSVFLELSLFLMFLLLLIVAIVIPTDPSYLIPVDESSRLQVSLHNNNLAGFILFFKLFMVLFSSPLLFLALLLRRTRKKNALLHEAFSEVKKMKEGFDGAVKGLGL